MTLSVCDASAFSLVSSYLARISRFLYVPIILFGLSVLFVFSCADNRPFGTFPRRPVFIIVYRNAACEMFDATNKNDALSPLATLREWYLENKHHCVRIFLYYV